MISISKRRGFTLFELLVTIAMIAIIMGALSFSINEAAERARVQKTMAEVKSITQTILAYENYTDGYVLPVQKEPAEANAQNLGFLLGIKDEGALRNLPTLLRAQLSAGDVLRDPWGTPYMYTIRKGKISPPVLGSLSTGFFLPNYHRLSEGERK